MLERTVIGLATTVVTIVVISIFIMLASSMLKDAEPWVGRKWRNARLVALLVAATLWMNIGLGCAMLIWAGTVYGLGLLDTISDASYFAAVSFTTLGFGDVVIEGEWRALSGMIAANGLILFSLVTAFLFEAIRKISGHS